MRRNIALIIILCLFLSFLASCSIGSGQNDATLTTQTNQLTETRVIQVTVTSTPTFDPEVCTHILRNEIRYYWNEESSSIIYDNIRAENTWFQIFIESGEVAVLTNDEVRQIVGTDRMYIQPNAFPIMVILIFLMMPMSYLYLRFRMEPSTRWL